MPDEREEHWYIRKEDIKAQLSEQEVGRLYEHSHRIYKTRGEIFWFDGSDGEPMDTPKVYFVDQGYARICKMSDEGKRLILTVLGPGEMFGAMSPDMETSDLEDYLEVVQDIRLISIDAKVYHEVLQNHETFTTGLIKRLEERRRHLEKRLSSLLFKDVAARTAEFLLEMHEKFGQECPYEPGVYRDLSLTHQELADIVGAARPVVSGVVSKMSKANYLRHHDRSFCLVDLDAIEDIAERGKKALS